MASSLPLSSDAKASLPAAVLGEPVDAGAAADARRIGRIGLWALLIGFGGFVAWASLAPLDEGVPGAGVVAIDT